MVMQMVVAVLDAQGAGIGKSIIISLRKEFGKNIYISALATNSVATINMLECGADIGFTGEDEICDFLDRQQIDAIIGPIGILVPGGINGEITLRIAQKVFGLKCPKYLIPLQKHGIYIPCTKDLKIKDFIQDIVLHLSQSKR